MAENTGIEWTNHTWNPWVGCQKISPGCKNCYMFREQSRYGKDPTDIRRTTSTFNNPLKWKEPALVFTCSFSDFFIEQADGWRADAWDIIRRTPHLTYQILTKRIERVIDHLPADWGEGYPNVWLGTSVENQKYADERIPLLLKVPAKVHFISAEPLLANVLLSKCLELSPYGNCYGCTDPDPLGATHVEGTIQHPRARRISWVIVGGESGNGARPLEPIWVRSIMNECKTAGVAFFMKQGSEANWKSFKDFNKFPEDLRVREFPIVK